jgi:hypothetical protein
MGPETTGPDKPAAEPESAHASITDAKLRKIISWAVVAVAAIATLSFFGFLAYHAIMGQATANTWPTAAIEKHFAAMVGTPLSAMTAYSIVSLLKVTNGPIEFEALGFKFHGASGPIILWVFCFLAIGIVFHLLWGSV